MPEPEDQTYSMDMEIFASGTWNGDTFTGKDLEDIVKNFYELRKEVKPFLKLGGLDPHKDLVQQPAIGWIDALRIENKRIIATVKDIPRIVYEAIKRKLYRRVSSELYVGLKANDGKIRRYVLRAVALLGASVPAVSTLRDLTAYLQEQLASDQIMEYAFESDEENKIILREVVMKDQVKEYEEKLAAEAAARKEAEMRAAEAEAKIKEYEENRIKEIRDSKIADVRAFCEQAVKEGKLPPFIRDALFPAEGAVVLSFTEDHAVMLPFEVMKDFIDKVKLIDFSEHGVAAGTKEDYSGKSAGEIIDIKARELCERGKAKTYSQAVQEVLKSDPELAKDYAIEGVAA